MFLTTDEKLKDEWRKILMIHDCLYEKGEEVALIQPLKSYISEHQYRAVNGIYDFNNADKIASGYYCKENNTGYIYVPGTGHIYNSSDYSILINNLLYEIAAKNAERLVLDFRGNHGGFIFAFAAAFLPLMSNWSFIEESVSGIKTKLSCTPEKFNVQYGYPEDVIIESHLHYNFKTLNFNSIYCLVDRESYSCGEIYPLLLKNNCGAVIHGELSGGAISSHDTAKIQFHKVDKLTYPGDRILDLNNVRQVIVDIDGIPDDIWPVHKQRTRVVKATTTSNNS